MVNRVINSNKTAKGSIIPVLCLFWFLVFIGTYNNLSTVSVPYSFHDFIFLQFDV